EICRSGLASRRRALVRYYRRIALNQLYPLKRHTQFFCNQLRLHGEHALTKIALSRVRSNSTVGRDCYPRIELFGIDVGRMRIEWTLHKSQRPGQRRYTETYNQGAGGFQEITA